jgi:hypothetical protein
MNIISRLGDSGHLRVPSLDVNKSRVANKRMFVVVWKGSLGT